MIRRDLPANTLATRLRFRWMAVSGRAVRAVWTWSTGRAAIWPGTNEADRFGTFGAGSLICFPWDSLVNASAIHIGEGTLIATHVALSAGWMPDQPGLAERIVTIGDRCLIGRGSSVIGHERITIGNDVWTGHHCHLTDMNHGYDDLELPISQQHQDPAPIVIGDGSWLGHGVVVLPGVTIGRGVTVGAGSVVTTDLPDHCVAVGIPARVVREYTDGSWQKREPQRWSDESGGLR